jgi:hypothetical protein
VIVVQQKGKLQLSEPRYVDPSFFYLLYSSLSQDA